MELIIERKIIKLNKKGNYGDSLVVTGKYGGKNKKQRYVTPSIYNKLLNSKYEELIDIITVKSNQMYMFEQ